MSQEVPPRSLKDQNRWQLWATIAANFLTFYAVAQFDAIASLGLKGLLIGAANLLPVGVALVVTSIANGLLNAHMKARLVYFRWHYPLPGHRAFSEHAPTDPRLGIDRLKAALGKELPTDPDEQNRTWYSIYKEMEHIPAVMYSHRDFLFARDYAAFAFLFFAGFGTAAIFLVHSYEISLIYCGCLLVQFLIVRHVAATYGVRLVTTVLARKAA